MKIVILSQNAQLYSTRRLVEAAQARGHEVSVVDPLRCYMRISSRKPTVHYRDFVLSEVDAVIPRVGASITFYGVAVVRQFEMGKVFTLNDSLSITRSRDKLRCLQILAMEGFDLPITSFAHSTKMTGQLIDMVGGAPLIVKLLEGTQGKGVILGQSREAAESLIESFRTMNAHFLVQEFISESEGSDIRCFVIGDQVVAAMRRVAKSGEFRANIHRGGRAEAVEITEQERELALKAARAMGLTVAGVDILRSNRGPLILEVNSSPGLEGIEGATEKNIAGLMIEHVEKHALLGNPIPTGRG